MLDFQLSNKLIHHMLDRFFFNFLQSEYEPSFLVYSQIHFSKSPLPFAISYDKVLKHWPPPILILQKRSLILFIWIFLIFGKSRFFYILFILRHLLRIIFLWETANHWMVGPISGKMIRVLIVLKLSIMLQIGAISCHVHGRKGSLFVLVFKIF